MHRPHPRAEASHRTKGLIRLTMACNARCPFCNVPVEAYDRPTPPASGFARELDRFVASGEKTLTISGGEPTLLRRRLVAAIARARGRGIPFVELQTNAVLIDEGYARSLAGAGLTSAFVSLLAHDPDAHDRLAGLPGAFDRCLRGIDALLAEGVRVTLNPVFARETQASVAGYVDFVAARLPAVRSISLSAVQPHGRAAADPELLPDYAVLAVHVRAARERARVHGIELLNPYCGLPACVGWDDDLSRSVEAIEGAAGGWRDTPGIANRGDKTHGAPCRRCVLRARCGGAWHAYWEQRGGDGLRPPAELLEPWEGEGAMQAVVRGFDADPAPALGRADAPVVWLWTDRLGPEAAAWPFTHLALELDARRLPMATLRAVRGLRGRRVHLGLRMGRGAVDLHALLTLATHVGVHAVTLLGSPAWSRAVLALAPAFPQLELGRAPLPHTD